MSAGGFKRINETMARMWLEPIANKTLRDMLNKVPQQQLYITYGAIKEAMLIQEAGKGIADKNDLTIANLKERASTLNTKDIEASAWKIFKELRDLARTPAFKDKGGIIVTNKMILITGTFREISELKLKLKKSIDASPAVKDFLNKTQLGHSLGVGAIGAFSVQSLAGSFNIPIPKDIQEDIDYIFDMELDNDLDLHIRKYSGVDAKINLTLEYDINIRRGAATSEASRKIKEWFDRELASKLRTTPLSSDKFNEMILTTKLSSSIEDDLTALTAAAFLGKKQNNVIKKRKASKKKTQSKKKQVRATSLPKSNIKKNKASSTNSLFGNLLHLQNVINLKLHETLKNEVMGQGGDPVALNYRTGRFARSAHLNQLVPMKGGLEAQITWQRYPYDTFAPGGKLHTPMRDPNFLIGQSIREILKEIGLQQIMISTRAQ